MSFYLPQEEDFVKRIMDLKTQAIDNKKVSLLKFLDERQQELVRFIIGSKDNVYAYFDGGFQKSEYKKCLISPFMVDNPKLNIRVFKLIYNKRFLTINHRMILGNLMSLGIKRDTIGDIVVGDDSFFACSSEVEGFLLMEFKTLNGKPISLEAFDASKLQRKEEYDIKQSFVSSLRLDVLIAAMYNLSRSQSSEMIKAGFIKVNHVLNMNVSHIIVIDDLISVRGKGRMKVFSIGNTTAKGRIRIEIGTIK